MGDFRLDLPWRGRAGGVLDDPDTVVQTQPMRRALLSAIYCLYYAEIFCSASSTFRSRSPANWDLLGKKASVVVVGGGGGDKKLLDVAINHVRFSATEMAGRSAVQTALYCTVVCFDS